MPLRPAFRADRAFDRPARCRRPRPVPRSRGGGAPPCRAAALWPAGGVDRQRRRCGNRRFYRPRPVARRAAIARRHRARPGPGAPRRAAQPPPPPVSRQGGPRRAPPGGTARLALPRPDRRLRAHPSRHRPLQLLVATAVRAGDWRPLRQEAVRKSATGRDHGCVQMCSTALPVKSRSIRRRATAPISSHCASTAIRGRNFRAAISSANRLNPIPARSTLISS